MCNAISWIEFKDKIYIITDAEIKSEKGKELIKKCGNNRDIWGHGFCREYYGLDNEGNQKEINDFFTKRKEFPKEIQKLLKYFNKNFGEMLSLYVPDLSGLTSLPDGVKFPQECGSLDLRGLTSLPDGVKFPEKIGGSLYLSGLTSLPDGVKFPQECGSLYLSGLTKKDRKKIMDKYK